MYYPPLPRQRLLLMLDDVVEVFYGGAAGGGKTVATLMAAAQYLEVPGYAALMLRENFADLDQPESWIPLSKSWWLNKPLGPGGREADYNESKHRWTFPSGATLTFGYLANDKAVYQYDTAAFQFIAIDELVQHSEFRYRFMFGRLRRPSTGPLSLVPIRMRTASNPGNIGHDWVKKRFVSPVTREPGAVYIPSRLEDNTGIDAEAYRKDSLSKLDPFTRAQRERGDWDAVPGGRFHAHWFPRFRQRPDGDFELHEPGGVVRVVPWSLCWRFQTADTAASTSTAADYTVISTWAVTPRNELLWLHCHRERLEIPDIAPLAQRLYDRWRVEFLEVEAVAAHSGAGIYQQLRRTPMAVRPFRPVGDPLVNSTQAQVLAEDGRVWVPEWAPWLEDCFAEVLRFSGDDKKDDHNDVVACLSRACRVVARKDQQNTGFAPRASGGLPKN